MARLTNHLWLVGLAAWLLVSWITVSLLPADPGPYSERPFAMGLLTGGAFGLLLIAVDLWRHPRRFWLWGLLAWGVILCLSTLDGVQRRDSDLDQTIGWGFVLGGLIGIPIIVVSALGWVWNRAARAAGRRRRWRVEVDDGSLKLSRRKHE